MVKFNKGVSELVNRALKNGESRDGYYFAKFYSEENILIVEHYGTKIFQANGLNIVRLGGSSASDQSAISTIMQTIGLPFEVTQNSKSALKSGIVGQMNGWYIVRK